MIKKYLAFSVLAGSLALAAACAPAETPAQPGAPGGSTASPAPGASSTPGAQNSGSSASGWSLWSGSVPCADKAAMWWDNENTALWGCGKRGDAGLHSTTDGGQTWTTHRRVNAKVNGFMRGADGKMYLAGQFGGGAAVLDESNPALFDYEPLYTRGRNAFTSVEQSESIGVTADGQILVDSLNGTTAAYHPGNNAAGKAWFERTCTGDDPSNFNPDSTGSWCELHGIEEEKLDNPDATVSQIADIQVMNNRFYAAGRWIADAGKVRLPSRKPGATYHMETVVVQNARERGEMTRIRVWPNGRIIATGTDQSNETPLIYLCAEGKDCYTPGNWERIEPDFFYTEFDSSVRDGRAVDAAGDHIVVVGNQVPNSLGGWAIQSRDGGKTWQNITPELAKLDPRNGKVSMLYDVKVFPSGKVLLFGDSNYVYQP